MNSDIYTYDLVDFEKLREEIEQQLKEREYEYESEYIEKILEEWYRQKRPLLELLSRHPNWNQKELMIHFEADYPRQIDRVTARNFLIWFRTEIDYDKSREIKNNKEMAVIQRFVERRGYSQYILDGEVGTEDIEQVNEALPKLRAKVGEKTSRVIRRLAKLLKIDESPLWEKGFAQYSDAINPLNIKRHTCISLNPLDYLLMSNGNSWKSCHYIGDYEGDAGCYSSGTISYMLDGVSFIFYTLDAGYDGETPELERKIQRQVFAYDSEGKNLLQSRLYPQSNDNGSEQIYTQIREVVQKVIADCENIENLWFKKAHIENVFRGEDATCYPDWLYGGGKTAFQTVHNSLKDEIISRMIIGAKPVCPKCGKRHEDTENIICEKCRDWQECESCGARISGDETYWIDGDPYCRDCVEYCEVCDEYYLPEDGEYVRSSDAWICRSCLEDSYERCEDCGEYYLREDMTIATNLYGYEIYVCNDCLCDGEYGVCEECGEWFAEEILISTEDCILCERCAGACEREEADS